MDYSILLKTVSRHITLTAAEQQYFIDGLEFKKIKAKKWLLKEGEVCKHSSFVLKGCLRAYAVDKNGFEHIMTFAPKGWWIADVQSLLSQKPGTLTLEAMQDAEVLMLPRKTQEQLYDKIPKFERFFRVIAENSLVSFQQRLMDNLSLSASERYLKFCVTYPGLIDKLHQKHVASYIGVTPEFLSKMKKSVKLS